MSSTNFKIWVRGTNWVGDCILSLPAVEALRQARPAAHITLAVRPWVSELFADVGAVDRIQIYDRQGTNRGWRGRERFISELKQQEYDQAILLPNSFESAYIAWRAGIPERVGYTTDGRGWLLTHRLTISDEVMRSHQTVYYLDILRQAGIINECPAIQRISLQISEERQLRARKRLDEAGIRARVLIGMNPGAYFGSAKRWLPERFAELADRFIDALQADVLIFGAANERPVAEAIARGMRHRPKIFSGETTLAELAALMQCCALVVTNDSGPMHLSAAVGTRTLAIFGPTDERATAPVGSHARVLKHPVSCSPCLLRECPLDHRCMTRITVEEVYGAAMDLLSR